MRWKPATLYGLISEPYRIGSFLIGDVYQHLVWVDHELIGQSTDLVECKRIADEHRKKQVTK